MEGRADSFALELTRDPKDFIDFQQRIAVQNVADPDPPDLIHLLFDTHPTTVERIGYGEAFRDK